MLYTPGKMESRDADAVLYHSLEPVIQGLGMSLIELSVYRGKGRGGLSGTSRRGSYEPRFPSGSVQIKAVVYREGSIGVEECSRVHRAILPRLELAFPGQDLYLEVSSPGIDRLIKDGSEFVHYIGRTVKCFRTDISDWTAGVLATADEKEIVLRGEDGETILPYGIIGKARLNG